MTARATFTLYRHEDVSGVSGTGTVAEGTVFSDGAVALRWPGVRPSTASWGSVEDVLATHGHDGKTELRWDGFAPPDETWLQRIAGLASRLKHSRVSAPGACMRDDGAYFPVQVRVQIHGRGDWLEWVAALGGSTDTATRHEHLGERDEVRWLTSDGQVCVFYLTERAS